MMIPGFVTIIVTEVSYVWQKKISFGPKCHGCVFFVVISAEAKNLESLQQKNWRAKCHQTRSLIQRGLWTIAVTPSRISRMHTIIRRCSKIFCVASHTVGYNKLCGIYLIFRLDLNYIMGSQRPWTVFELLDLNYMCVIKELELFRVCLDIFMH